MAGFTCRFSRQLDSKGRITIPARIRNRLKLETGDEVSLSIQSSKVVREQFETMDTALKFLCELGEVESFSFDGETLEVILNE